MAQESLKIFSFKIFIKFIRIDADGNPIEMETSLSESFKKKLLTENIRFIENCSAFIKTQSKNNCYLKRHDVDNTNKERSSIINCLSICATNLKGVELLLKKKSKLNDFEKDITKLVLKDHTEFECKIYTENAGICTEAYDFFSQLDSDSNDDEDNDDSNAINMSSINNDKSSDKISSVTEIDSKQIVANDVTNVSSNNNNSKSDKIFGVPESDSNVSNNEVNQAEPENKSLLKSSPLKSQTSTNLSPSFEDKNTNNNQSKSQYEETDNFNESSVDGFHNISKKSVFTFSTEFKIEFPAHKHLDDELFSDINNIIKKNISNISNAIEKAVQYGIRITDIKLEGRNRLFVWEILTFDCLEKWIEAVDKPKAVINHKLSKIILELINNYKSVQNNGNIKVIDNLILRVCLKSDRKSKLKKEFKKMFGENENYKIPTASQNKLIDVSTEFLASLYTEDKDKVRKTFCVFNSNNGVTKLTIKFNLPNRKFAMLELFQDKVDIEIWKSELLYFTQQQIQKVNYRYSAKIKRNFITKITDLTLNDESTLDEIITRYINGKRYFNWDIFMSNDKLDNYKISLAVNSFAYHLFNLCRTNIHSCNLYMEEITCIFQQYEKRLLNYQMSNLLINIFSKEIRSKNTALFVLNILVNSKKQNWPEVYTNGKQYSFLKQFVTSLNRKDLDSCTLETFEMNWNRLLYLFYPEISIFNNFTGCHVISMKLLFKANELLQFIKNVSTSKNLHTDFISTSLMQLLDVDSCHYEITEIIMRDLDIKNIKEIVILLNEKLENGKYTTSQNSQFKITVSSIFDILQKKLDKNLIKIQNSALQFDITKEIMDCWFLYNFILQFNFNKTKLGDTLKYFETIIIKIMLANKYFNENSIKNLNEILITIYSNSKCESILVKLLDALLKTRIDVKEDLFVNLLTLESTELISHENMHPLIFYLISEKSCIKEIYLLQYKLLNSKAKISEKCNVFITNTGLEFLISKVEEGKVEKSNVILRDILNVLKIKDESNLHEMIQKDFKIFISRNASIETLKIFSDEILKIEQFSSETCWLYNTIAFGLFHHFKIEDDGHDNCILPINTIAMLFYLKGFWLHIFHSSSDCKNSIIGYENILNFMLNIINLYKSKNLTLEQHRYLVTFSKNNLKCKPLFVLDIIQKIFLSIQKIETQILERHHEMFEDIQKSFEKSLENLLDMNEKLLNVVYDSKITNFEIVSEIKNVEQVLNKAKDKFRTGKLTMLEMENQSPFEEIAYFTKEINDFQNVLCSYCYQQLIINDIQIFKGDVNLKVLIEFMKNAKVIIKDKLFYLRNNFQNISREHFQHFFFNLDVYKYNDELQTLHDSFSMSYTFDLKFAVEKLTNYSKTLQRVKNLDSVLKIFNIDITKLSADPIAKAMLSFLERRNDEDNLKDFCSNMDKVNDVMKCLTEKAWDVAKVLCNCQELITFVKDIVDEDLHNLTDAVEEHDEQYVNQQNIRELIECKRFLQYLVKEDNIEKFCHHLKNAVESSSSNIAGQLDSCSEKVNSLKNLYKNVANRGEATKWIVRKVIKHGKYQVKLKEDGKCSGYVKYEREDGKYAKHNCLDLEDIRSRLLLISTDKEISDKSENMTVEEIEKFSSCVDLLINVVNLVKDFHFSGHFEFFTFQFKDLISELELEKEKSKLQRKFEEWSENLNEIRLNKKSLNYFYSTQFYDIFKALTNKQDNDDILISYMYYIFGDTLSVQEIPSINYDGSDTSEDRLNKIARCLNPYFVKMVNKRPVKKTYSKLGSLGSRVDKGCVLLSVLSKISKDVIPVLMNVFISTTGQLPSAKHVIFCEPETEFEEIRLLLDRCAIDSHHLYCLAFVERLSEEVTNCLLSKINNMQNTNEVRQFRLCILIRADQIHPVVDSLSMWRGGHSLRIENMQSIFYDLCPLVKAYSSETPGVGKSEKAYDFSEENNCNLVKFPLSGYLSKSRIVKRLKELHLKKSHCLHIQIDEITDPAFIDSLLFQILVLKCIRHGTDIIHIPTNIIAIEIASSENKSLLNSLIIPKCLNLEIIDGNGIDDLIISNEPLSPMQICCQFLKLIDEKKLDTTDLIFNPTYYPSPLNDIVCKYLLKKHILKGNLTVRLLHVFLKVFADQLKRLSYSAYFKTDFLKSIFKGKEQTIRSSLVNELLNVSLEFAQRSINICKKSQRSSLENTAIALSDRMKGMIRWEESNHTMVIFHLSDNQSVSPVYRKLERVSESFNDLFKSQQQPLKDLQTLNSDELQNILFRIARKSNVEMNNDVITELKDYALTTDNLLKMILIMLRINAHVPVVIMGETGCGKTSLVKYLARISNVEFSVFNIHAGISEYDILHKMDKISEKLKHFNDNIWLFLDEINTCDHLGIISEIICHHSIFGKPLPNNLIIMAACNPYRLRSENSLKTAGLPQKIKEDKLSRLAYRVHPLPESLLDFVWDFGSLDKVDERRYIENMISKCSDDPHIRTIFVDCLCESQEFIRKLEDSEAAVSLRDIDRSRKLMIWFVNILKNKQQVLKKDPITYDKVKKAIILSLAHCYHSRIGDVNKRTEYCEKMNNILKTDMDMESVIKQEQMEWLNCFDLPKCIAKNTALRENVFIMIVCILNKLPVFVVGKPGCSKSLAMQLIRSNIRGKDSKNDFLKTLPHLMVVSFQGSETSTSDGILKVFEKAKGYQKRKNDEDDEEIQPVVLLDEVGLAAISRFNPLKVLHSLLEPPEVSVVGISNWALDAAKMNRAIHLSRPEPDTKELYDTALSITETKGDNNMLLAASEAFFIYQSDKNLTPRNFHGLRDFYSFVKYLSNAHITKVSKHAEDKIRNIIVNGLERNFGGTKDSFKNILSLFCDKISLNIDLIDLKSTLELIRNNVSDLEARHLMIISHGSSSLSIIENILMESEKKYEVIIGSSFENDLVDQYNYRILNKVILCMETGITLVLSGLDNVYGSLYDMLNQNYTKVGETYNCRIALGPYSNPLCMVHKDFKCIVLVDHDKVDYADPPFLNRFEKQILRLDANLSESQNRIVKDLNGWIENFSNVSSDFKKEDAMMGYSLETIQTLVEQQCKCVELSTDIDKKLVFENSKFELLNLITPDAAIRAQKSKLIEINRKQCTKDIDWYFDRLPLHEGLTSYLNVNITNETNISKFIIFTHSNIHCKIPNDADGFQIQSLKVGACKTEQKLSNNIQQFFEDSNIKNLLLLQCSSTSDLNHFFLTKTLVDKLQQMNTRQETIYKKFIVLIVHVEHGNHNFICNYTINWKIACVEPLFFDYGQRNILEFRKKNLNDILKEPTTLTPSMFQEFLKRAFTGIKYTVANPPLNHFTKIIDVLLQNDEFVYLIKNEVIAFLKRDKDVKHFGNKWLIDTAFDQQKLCGSIPIVQLLERNLIKFYETPLFRIVALMEEHCIWFSYFDDNCSSSEFVEMKKQFWKNLANQLIFNRIDSIDLQPGVENFSCNIYILNLKFPFSRHFYANTILQHKELFIQELIKLEYCENNDDNNEEDFSNQNLEECELNIKDILEQCGNKYSDIIFDETEFYDESMENMLKYFLSDFIDDICLIVLENLTPDFEQELLIKISRWYIEEVCYNSDQSNLMLYLTNCILGIWFFESQVRKSVLFLNSLTQLVKWDTENILNKIDSTYAHMSADLSNAENFEKENNNLIETQDTEQEIPIEQDEDLTDEGKKIDINDDIFDQDNGSDFINDGENYPSTDIDEDIYNGCDNEYQIKERSQEDDQQDNSAMTKQEIFVNVIILMALPTKDNLQKSWNNNLYSWHNHMRKVIPKAIECCFYAKGIQHLQLCLDIFNVCPNMSDFLNNVAEYLSNISQTNDVLLCDLKFYEFFHTIVDQCIHDDVEKEKIVQHIYYRMVKFGVKDEIVLRMFRNIIKWHDPHCQMIIMNKVVDDIQEGHLLELLQSCSLELNILNVMNELFIETGVESNQSSDSVLIGIADLISSKYFLNITTENVDDQILTDSVRLAIDTIITSGESMHFRKLVSLILIRRYITEVGKVNCLNYAKSQYIKWIVNDFLKSLKKHSDTFFFIYFAKFCQQVLLNSTGSSVFNLKNQLQSYKPEMVEIIDIFESVELPNSICEMQFLAYYEEKVDSYKYLKTFLTEKENNNESSLLDNTINETVINDTNSVCSDNESGDEFVDAVEQNDADAISTKSKNSLIIEDDEARDCIVKLKQLSHQRDGFLSILSTLIRQILMDRNFLDEDLIIRETIKNIFDKEDINFIDHILNISQFQIDRFVINYDNDFQNILQSSFLIHLGCLLYTNNKFQIDSILLDIFKAEENVKNYFLPGNNTYSSNRNIFSYFYECNECSTRVCLAKELKDVYCNDCKSAMIRVEFSIIENNEAVNDTDTISDSYDSATDMDIPNEFTTYKGLQLKTNDNCLSQFSYYVTKLIIHGCCLSSVMFKFRDIDLFDKMLYFDKDTTCLDSFLECFIENWNGLKQLLNEDDYMVSKMLHVLLKDYIELFSNKDFIKTTLHKQEFEKKINNCLNKWYIERYSNLAKNKWIIDENSSILIRMIREEVFDDQIDYHLHAYLRPLSERSHKNLEIDIKHTPEADESRSHLVKLFFDFKTELKLLKHAPVFVKWHKSIFTELSSSLVIDSSLKNKTIGSVLKTNKLRKLFDSYKNAWNDLAEEDFVESMKPIESDTSILDCCAFNEKSILVAALKKFCKMQQNVLDSVLMLSVQYDKITPELSSLRKVYRENIINSYIQRRKLHETIDTDWLQFDWDELSIKESFWNINYGCGKQQYYNWTSLSWELAHEITAGKKTWPYFDKSFTFLSMLTSRQKPSAKLLLEISDIIPQTTLDMEIKMSIKKLDNNREIVNEMFTCLESIFWLLKQTKGKPKTPLLDYCKSWELQLPSKFPIGTLCQPENKIQLQHICSLYEHFEDFLAESVVSKLEKQFKFELIPETRKTIEKRLDEIKLQLNALKIALRRYAFRQLKHGTNINSNEPLINELNQPTLWPKDKIYNEDVIISDNFDNEKPVLLIDSFFGISIHVKHFHEFYKIVEKMLKEQTTVNQAPLTFNVKSVQKPGRKKNSKQNRY